MASTQAPPRIEAVRIDGNGPYPNNPDLPLLVYRGVLSLAGDAASGCEALFERNRWGGGWRSDQIYPFHHYHATRHEAVGVVRGQARVRFGGEGGMVVEVQAGDVVVIPAGVSHKSESRSPDFLIIGAYPDGIGDPDTGVGEPGRRADEVASIKRTKLPPADPVMGEDGPLMRRWRGDRTG